MSDNYKPTAKVVRHYQFASGSWIPEDGRYPDSDEQALLIQGVPMVGDRVNREDGSGVVIGYAVYVRVQDEKTGLLLTPSAYSLRPATQDAEVEAMLSAFFEARAHKMSDRDIVRSVREALDRVRGAE